MGTVSLGSSLARRSAAPLWMTRRSWAESREADAEAEFPTSSSMRARGSENELVWRSRSVVIIAQLMDMGCASSLSITAAPLTLQSSLAPGGG